MDADGYPEESELERIKNWSIKDNAGLIAYIRERWAYSDYFIYNDYNLELHTAGWSGNEAIIGALRETVFWAAYWVKSERGGHYYFDLTNAW